jgi:hypothetical protein
MFMVIVVVVLAVIGVLACAVVAMAAGAYLLLCKHWPGDEP